MKSFLSLFNFNRRPLSVFLHFPCFDGVVSAALIADALRLQSGTQLGSIEPVNYDQRASWLSRTLPPNSAVVDFLFHPSATVWADHHETTFIPPSTPNDLSRIKSGKTYLYDPTAKSCAEVIWKAFRDGFARTEPWTDIVGWASKVDSASYDNVEEALFGSQPALRISRSLTVSPDTNYCEFLVRSLLAEGLGATAKSEEVSKRAENAEKRIGRGLKVAEKLVARIGDIVVMDVPDQPKTTVISRYAPYYFFPDAKYSITTTQFGTGTKITAMRNPWLDFANVPIGPLLSAFGGGGHSRVGSVVVSREDRKKIGEIIDKLLGMLQQGHKVGHKEGLPA